MSYAGQSPAPFAPLPQGSLPYELQLVNAQRQQRLAEQLQQQIQDPIQVQQGGGAPAPISWGSVLAKALQGYNASSKENYARNQLQQIGQQDNQSAQDLARQLTAHTVGTPSLAAPTGQMDATAPQLPGGPAPASVSAPNQMPAAPGGQMGTPDPNAQLAALLSAHGGPQTQAIQQAMIPQVLGRQNADYEHTLKRSDLDYQNAMPMSAATGQQIAAQGQQEQANSRFTNKLPQTAQQKAELGLGYAQLNKPVDVTFGSTLVNPRTGQVMYSGAPDTAAVQTGIDFFKKFGTFPPNARSPAMQQAIMAGIHNQRISMDDAANSRAGVHAQMSAAANMGRTQVQTAVNEGTVNNSIGIVRKLLPAAGSQGTFTDINDLMQNLGRRTNDTNAVLLRNGIDSISNEYARVMTGTTSGSPSSDSARREAGNRILYGYNTGTIDDVLGQMQQEMAGRSGSQAQALGDVTGGSYKGARVPGAVASPATTGTAAGWSNFKVTP